MLIRQFEKNKIRLIHGSACFQDRNHVIVLDGQGKKIFKIAFDYFLIATGSKPRNPNNVPFDDEKILDSTRLLSIDHVPKTLLVLGGGMIGAEYASFFAAWGTEVTVIDKRDHLLPLLDTEIGMHLQKALNAIGLKVLGNKELGHIRRLEDDVEVTFKDGGRVSRDVALCSRQRG